MATTTNMLTAEDVWNMPDNGGRNELVRGELREMAPANFRHGSIISNIDHGLSAHVRSNKLGIVSVGDPGFILARNPDLVRAPDVCFIKTERMPSPDAQRWIEMAPDLVIEVVSPSDTAYHVEEKTEDWINAGCRMVVVVSDRRRTVTVHRPGSSPIILRGADVLDGADVVPGFRMPLTDIFA